MAITVGGESIIYVAAPAGVATGGPELLHQLVFHLRNSLDLNACMYYYPANHLSPIHENYKVYDNEYTNMILDESNNILICPESYKGLSLFGNFKNIKKILWWLGVDNFYQSKLGATSFTYKLIRKIDNILQYNMIPIEFTQIILKYMKNKDHIKDVYVQQADYHLAQSYYAFDHLLSKRIDKSKIYYLSDYLNNDFLNENYDINQKQDIVVYNPKKGLPFTLKLIKKAHKVKFVPIKNMTRNEVINILKRAKVYIDFGNHSGKDRIPREAAILGCCVLVGKEGSALYEDVPIPDDYKFAKSIKEINNIIFMINDCIKNYKYHAKKFDNYREIIRNEPKKFVSDLKLIFNKRNG